MALVVLDSSALIAFLDPRDAHHAGAVASLSTTHDDTLVLPASGYAEALVHPYRQRRAAHIEQLLAEFSIAVHPIDVDIARRAAQIRARKASVALPDALIIAAGDVLDADVVLTADARWQKVSERARLT